MNPGASMIMTPPASDFHVLTVVNGWDIIVRDLSVIESQPDDDEKRPTGDVTGFGVAVTGQSNNILFESVISEGFLVPSSVGRGKGVTSAITFRRCIARRSRSYGFEINHTRQLLLEQCQANHNNLDGFKLRQRAKNVTIRDGEASHNGQNVEWDGSGVDGYASGDAFVIEHLLVEHNNGSGIYIKTGPLVNEEFGPIQNSYINGVRARFNVGSAIPFTP